MAVPFDEFEAARKVLNDRRAVLHPVSAVDVQESARQGHQLRPVNMAAHHALATGFDGVLYEVVRESALALGHAFHRFLEGRGEVHWTAVLSASHSVDPVVNVEGRFVHPSPRVGHRAVGRAASVEQVAVLNQELSSVRKFVNERVLDA